MPPDTATVLKMLFVSSIATFSLMLLFTPHETTWLTAVVRKLFRLHSSLPSIATFAFTLLLMHGRYNNHSTVELL